MNTYKVRYIHGPQENLVCTGEELVEASSVGEALAPRSSWPIEMNMSNTCGWAKKPGNSIYYVEAWEAELQRGLSPTN